MREDQARESMSKERLQTRLARREAARVDRHEGDHRQPSQLDRDQQDEQRVRHDCRHRTRPREEQQGEGLCGSGASHPEMSQRQAEHDDA